MVNPATNNDNGNNLKSDVSVAGAKTDLTSQNDSQSVANSVKANISATDNKQAALTKNITAPSQNTKAPSVNNNPQSTANSTVKAQAGAQTEVKNSAAHQVTQSALKQDQTKQNVAETSQNELSQINQTEQKTDNSSDKLNLANLNLAANNNLNSKQDLKEQDILSNLVNAKQNNDQANAVTTSSFNSREYAKTSEAALEASLISSSKNGQNNGQAASGQVKQVVIAGENKAKTADLDNNVGSKGVKSIAPDQIDSAPQVKEATDTLKANSGRAYSALKDLADELDTGDSNTVSLSTFLGNSKGISEGELKRILGTSLAKDDENAIKVTVDSNYAPEIINGLNLNDKGQIMYAKFGFKPPITADPDYGLFLTLATDKDPSIAGQHIYYYVSDSNGKIYRNQQGELNNTNHKDLVLGEGAAQFYLHFYQNPNNSKEIASSIDTGGYGIVSDYGGSSYVGNPTLQGQMYGGYARRGSTVTVEYVDVDTGNAFASTSESGIDFYNYYDATNAVKRNDFSGYSRLGTWSELSTSDQNKVSQLADYSSDYEPYLQSPLTGNFDSRDLGDEYVTGDITLPENGNTTAKKLYIHKVVGSDGKENISLFKDQNNSGVWKQVIPSNGNSTEYDSNGNQIGSTTLTVNSDGSVTFPADSSHYRLFPGDNEELSVPVSYSHNKIIVFYQKAPDQKQNAQVNFVDDDNNGSSLHDAISATGNSGNAITFSNAAAVVSDLAGTNTTDPNQTTKDDTKNYIFAGVTADTTADAITKSGYTFSGVTFPKYDSDENTTQTFTVHFKHKITESTISKKVNLSVKYQNEDGSDAGVTAPANATNQTLTFTGTAKKDAVTGNYLNADGTQADATTPVYTWIVSGGTTDGQNKGTFASVTTPTKEGYTVKSVMEGSTSVDDGSGNVKAISVANPSSNDPDEQTVNVVVTYQKKSAPVVGNYKEITVTRTLVRNIDYKINSNKATDYDPSSLTDMDLNKLSNPHTQTQTVTLEGVGVIDTTTGQLVAFDHTFDSNGNVVVTPGQNGDAFVVEKDSSGKAKQGQFYWRLPNGSKFAGFDNPTADGFTSETGYDENGKMSPVADPSKVPEVDVTKDTQVNVYDSKGNLISTPTVRDLLNQWNKDTVSEPVDNIKDDSKYPDTNGIVPTNQYIFDQFQLTDDKENLLDTIVTLAVDPTDSTGKVYVYFTNSNYTQTWYKHIAWPNGGSVYYGTTDNDLYETYNNGNYVLDNHGNKIINPNHHIISVYNFGGDSGNSVSVSVDNYNYYNLKRIFGYGTQFTGDDNYSSSWGDYKPSSVSQTISFVDQDTGKPIQGYATIKNNGVTGESYDFSNFKAPEIPGYELVYQPAKTGSLSDFKVGQTYTRTWMTVTGVKITEAHKILNDSGEVQTYVWVNGQLYSETPFDILKNGYLKGEGNQTPDVTVQDSDGDQTTYVIQNPYVPQTTDLKYVYKKVNTSLKENPVFVVYTPGNTVASMTVKYEDEDDDDRVLQADPISGSVGNSINYSTTQSIQNFEKQGYVLDQDNYPFRTTDKFTDANNGQTYTVLLKHRAIQVTPNTPSSDLPKNTPDDAQPQNLTVTVTRNISYKLDNGSGNPATMSDMTGIPSTAVKQQTVTFTGTTFVDAVTGHKVHAVTGKDSQGKDIYVVDNSDTTPVKITWSVDNNGKFASVIAPNVAGYTHSPQTIAEERVVRPSESYTEPTIYVVYTPNAVQDIVKYIDDTTNKTLRTDSGSTFDTLKGQPNDAVTYTTSGIIQNYENQGYILASTQPKPFTDGQMKFGTAGQTYEVHFIHKIDNIDKDNPHGQTVTKTVTRKVYYTVDGVPATDVNLQDKTETATFDATGYYDEVAKQVVDLETGTTADQGKVQLNSDVSIKEGILTWTAEGGTTDSANLAGYDAPTKTGYHVNNITVEPAADKADNVIDAGQTNAGQVKGINVNHNSHDVTIYINLTKDPVANPQAAKITVIDEDNHTANNQLASAQISGKAGSAISFGNMSNTVQNYIKNGYVWDYSNEGTTKLSATNYAGINFGKFDSDDNTTQNWTIYLRHRTTHVDHDHPGNGYSADDLQKTVTTKISYVDDKGNEISGLDPVSHSVTFNGQGDYDNVTKQWVKVDRNGKITAAGLTWTYVVDNQASQNGDSTTLSAIDAKSPSGYTYAYTSGSWDSKLGVHTTDGSVEQQTVTPSTADSNIIVHFNKKPTAQANIAVTYHDDTTNTDLKTDTEKPQDVGSNITYSTKPSIDDYKKQGYKLVSDANIPSTMPATGFTEIVHLAHDTASQPVTETAKAHVHYVISGNPTEPDAPADSDTQTITWSKTDTIDKVTGKVTKEGTWTPEAKSFNNVTSPTVTGYTPSQTSVNFATPVRGQDQVVTVVYTKNPTEVTYHTKDDTREVTRIIKYLDSEDHSKSLATPVTQTAELSRKEILDNNNKFVGYGTVSADGKSYTLSEDYTVTSNGWIAVDSPDETAKGYKKVPHFDDGSDASTVSAGTVNSNTPAQTTINVYYDHDTVVVPPTNPGHGLTAKDLNKTVTRTIKYQDNNGTAVNGSPDGKSTYVQTATFTRTAIVDKTNDQFLGFDTNGDGKVDVLPAAGDYAWTATNSSNQFASVPSKAPSEVGYNHVDIQNVSSITVGPKSDDSTVTVTYSKDAQQGSFQIHYIDEDDNDAVLHSDSESGKYGDSINYDPTTETNTLTDQGYAEDTTYNKADKYVGQTSINKDNNGKIFIIAFKHKTKQGTTEIIVPTETIHFRYADGTTAAPDVQVSAGNFKFTRTPTLDAVTGHVINAGTWNEESYTFNDGTKNVQVINGYVADKATYGNKTATPTDKDVEDVVIYRKISNIIPVDQNGNQIPGTTTVTYTNDPNDPTKVMPNETSPSVPSGWTISTIGQPDGVTPNTTNNTATVTPADPTKPTKVVYTEDSEKATLHIIDINDGDKELNHVQASGQDNSGINFTNAQTTIDEWLNKGYKVNSIEQATTDPNKPISYANDYAKASATWTFDDKPGVDQEFYVYLEHDYAPINPENPHGRTDLTRQVKETIHYVDEATNRPVVSDYTNTLTFTGQGMVDKVTHKMLAVKSVVNGQITYDNDLSKEIDISKAKDSDFVWSNPSSFAKVTSPTIAGYTIDADKTDQNSLAANGNIQEIDNVGYDHSNVEATVYYKANPVHTQEAATLTIIDDTTGGQLADYSVTGQDGAAISFKDTRGKTANSQIGSYLNHGYDWEKSSANGLTATSYDTFDYGKLDTDPNTNQTWTIYLVHKTKQLTPSDKYGNENLDKKITRNVQYKYDDGTTAANQVDQTVEFNGQGYIDQVTGQLVQDDGHGHVKKNADGSIAPGQITWKLVKQDDQAVSDGTDKATFTQIGKPTVDQNSSVVKITSSGDVTYSVNNDGSVDAQNLTHQNNDSNVVIVYHKGTVAEHHTAELTIYANDKQVGTATATGDKETDISFADAGSIVQAFEDNGYHFDHAEDVSNNKQIAGRNYNDIKFGKYLAANNSDQKFAIYLTKASVENSSLKIVDDTENRTLANYGQSGKTGDAIKFTDGVAQLQYYLSNGYKWSKADKNGTALTDLTGKNYSTYNFGNYQDNENPVWTIHLVHLNKNITKQGTIEVIYHDNTSDVDLTGYGQTTTKQDEGTSFAYDPNSKDLPALEKLHYVVDGQLPTIPTKYTDGDQRIVIYVRHGTKNESVSKTVTRDFIYVFSDGTRATAHTTTDGQPVSEAAQAVTFNGHKIIDLVTGKTVSVDKDGNINGFGGVVWDKDSLELHTVPAKAVKGYHVVSTRNAHVDGSVGEVTVTPNSGDIHVRITYAPDEHKAETVVGKQTVHYVDGDDNNAKLLDDNVNSTFTFTKDGKTGQWNAESHQYDDANAPVISGYVADQKTYTGQTATPTDPNKEITIIYHKISKIISVDNKGNKIPNQPTPTYVNDPKDPTKVVSNQPTPNIPGWHITNNPNPGKTPDGKTDIHTVTPVDPTKPTKVTYEQNGTTLKNQKTVTASQKVKYQDDKGNTLSPAKDQSFTFTYSGDTYDTFTGDLIKKGTWNVESHNFDGENVPVIAGYTLSSGFSKNGNSYIAGGFTTDPNASDKDRNRTFIVVYSKTPNKPVATTGSITYYDDTDNRSLESASFNGNAGDKINYTTADRVSYYEGLGYDLVSNNFADGSQTFSKDASKNVFAAHLKHATVPITPQHPGKPGQEVPKDPKKPNEPNHKYPNNYQPRTLTKDVTRTISYVFTDGKRSLDPVKKTIEFTGQGTLDLVTGHLVTVNGDHIEQNGSIKWNPSDAHFDPTKAIDMNGYYISSVKNTNSQAAVDSNTGAVSGETVTPTSNNIDIVITLKPNSVTPPTHTTQIATLTIHDTIANIDLGHVTVQGSDGNAINFGKTPADQISYYLAHGYKWENATYNGNDLKVNGIVQITFGNFDKNDDSQGASQAWVINLVHGYTPVNPDHPDDKDGYTKDYLDRKITRDITYINGQTGKEMDNLPAVHQSTEFKGSGYLDNVTGKWVKVENGAIFGSVAGLTWTPDDQSFTKVDAPNPSGFCVDHINETNVNGYTVGKDGAISAQTVNKDTANSKVEIAYMPVSVPKNVQQANLTIIDDTNNNILAQYNNSGESGNAISFNDYSSDVIENYIKQGYVVVGLTNDNNSAIDAMMNGTEPTKWNFGKYDDKNDISQNFTITLKHGTENITPNNPDPDRGYTKDSLTKTGTQTIHYIITGSDSDKPSVPADHKANVTFTHSLTIDKVTGKVMKDNGWTPGSGTYAQVDTPIINGYEADKKNISAKMVTIDPKTSKGNIDDYEVVVYTKTPAAPDKAAGTVVYIDDTAQKTLTTDDLSGQVGSQIDYTTAGKITDYEKQGYKLVSNNFRDGQEIFAKTGNNFAVHLIHTFIPINPKTTDKHGVDPDILEKTVTETVHYEGADKQTPKDNVQTSKWSKQVTYDEVTGKVVTNGQYDTDWSIEPGQKTVYDQVNTPNVPGYQPDQNNVPATEVTQNNITKTVTYSKNPAAQAHIVITYHDDTTDKDLKTDTEPNQDVGTNITYSTHPSISEFKKQGYRLVSDVTLPKTMPQDGFTGIVYLAHTYSPVDQNHPHDGIEMNQYQKDVTATVHYVYSDGTRAHDDNVQKVTWTRVLTIDNVTGQIAPNGKDDKPWTADKKSYEAVSSPAIAGYHPDKITVPAKTVTQDNLEETVIYVKNGTVLKNQQTVTASQTVEYQDDQGHTLSPSKKQNFTFTYTGDTYDANTGKLISKGKWNAENHSFTAENVPVIDGYVAVSGFVKNGDAYNAGGFATDHDASDTQRNRTFVVVYKKISSIVPVTPDHKPIPNPDKPGSNVPSKPYVNDPKDPTKVFKESVPTIPGYKPNTSTVTPSDPTKPTEVTYTKKPSTETGIVTITVHDNTTGQDLHQYNYSSDKDGKPQSVGTKIDYNKTQTITDLINHGYKVINPDVSIPSSVTKGNTSVTIDVEHTTTTVTLDKPGVPGQPIDPANPNGPKYPIGTDIGQLEKKGTQTIHYTGAGNQTPADNTQSFTFTRQITFDNVTEKITNTTPWNVASHTFTEVETPVVQGYHADRKSAGGTKITPEDLNKTIVVAYTSNGKIIPVDQNGQPIPGAPQPVLLTNPTDPTKVDSGKIPEVSGYEPDNGKVGDPVAPNSQDPHQDVKIPYRQSPIPAPGPINPEPAAPGTVPAASKPTASKPTSPAQPTTAPKPSEPQKPDLPAGPKRSKYHHNSHHRSPIPTNRKGTNTPRSTSSTAPTPGYNYNNMPHSQNGYWSSNNPPISETTPTGGNNGHNFGPIGQTLPNGDRIIPNGEVVSASGQVVGYVDKNGQVHYTLPQTGQKQNESLASALAGGIAVSIGLIGLAGVKKRRSNNL